LAPTPPADVLLRMCRNLMNTYTQRYKSEKDELVRVLGMALAIAPDDIQIRRQRARTALSIDMLEVVLGDAARLEADAEEGAELLRQARQRDRQRTARSVLRMRRPDDVTRQVTGREPTSSARLASEPTFHVGMVVRHQRSHWYGVIGEWALEHESHRSNNQKRLQLPCYTVAVDLHCKGVNSLRNGIAYVPEHELERRLPPSKYEKQVEHPQVAEWFTHYDEKNDMYIPNDYVRYRFPDDHVFPPLV
jgi:hemimethylated DNA binding protein